ncbi:MAG TPA: ATP-dependent DNA helicase [Gammaproteobacteria bacterium]|nr:ATP-dependent DNA helicase [Chromatiales bacterium]HPQ23578.1 ATP-dependent DNA helicase [Gammaproteobacteria bacterium]
MEIAEVLGPDGLLARSIDGFAYRSQQLGMAEAVAAALDQGGSLVAEAGTGTGKTFAYLVPALLSGQKVIISTGTRNLQDQLFLRDLPRLREAMASPARVALLKGRANYLCIHRMESAMLDARGQRREDLRWLLKVRDWSAHTDRGDISELGDVPEDAAIWPLVTSTTDNCLGQECSAWSRCHLVEARRRAQEADVVVVNHHLLCADFSLKDDGFGELLPAADAFIVDEAHQLPEVASNFFGTTVSTRQILDLMRDTQAEYHREAGDLPKLLEHLDVVSKSARDLRLAFGQTLRRGPWNEIEADSAVTQALDDCRDRLDELHGMLEAIQGRGKGLDACLARCEGLGRQIDGLVSPEEGGDVIRWFETHPQSLRLNSTPLDVADVFRLQMQRHPASWIFTSATLAVGDSFEHFQRQLGLDDALTCKWDSPFDYSNQALWYVPRGMPQPSDPGYTQAVVELVLPIVEASAGRAFLLFTSHRALREAADLLHERLTFPLLVQGSAPKAELLERFVEHGNAVLLGTASFWEGVDVRGEALSVVIIDKLPFASPGDPVLQARLDAVRRSGGNPFMQHQVPQAAIALKQGAGRLIRDVTDRGVLVLCDPRLLKKGYGQTFLDAMPPFARTRDLEQVLAFFR